MTDRVKESVFNIIGHRLGSLGAIPDVPVLDLFAGSGALGIECLSRGARSCLFVERDRHSLQALRRNIAATNLAGVSRIAAENAWTLRVPPIEGGYGLMLLDPPYADMKSPVRTLDLLARLAPHLAVPGLVVLRYPAAVDFPFERMVRLHCADARVMGTTQVALLAAEPAAPAEDGMPPDGAT